MPSAVRFQLGKSSTGAGHGPIGATLPVGATGNGVGVAAAAVGSAVAVPL